MRTVEIFRCTPLSALVDNRMIQITEGERMYPIRRRSYRMATQLQATVSSALQELKLKADEGGMPGSPVTLSVTEETLEYLRGKKITVDSDGKLTVA